MALPADQLPEPDPWPKLAVVERASSTCRVGGCAERATTDELCTAHGLEQARRRAAALESPSRQPVVLPQLPVSRPTWHARAACRGLGPGLFYPLVDERYSHSTPYVQGRQVCSTCPVIDQCAEAGALEHHGLWGGESPRQRHERRKRSTTSEPTT